MSLIVVGDDTLITHDSGKSGKVGLFSEQLGKISNVPIVDCVVAHDCKYSGRTIYLEMYNALYIPSIKENLIPPFLVWRQGNVVNDVPKIQILGPTEEDHYLILDDGKTKIPLKLDGTMSYFYTRKPNVDEYQQAMTADLIIDLNVNEPKWDPSDNRFSQDEDNMLDFEGKIIDPKYRTRMLLGDDKMKETYRISAVNVIYEDEDTVSRVLQQNVNDGSGQ